MSLICQDPTTREWVILATDRGKRLHDFQQINQEKAVLQFDFTCPFCPGNEAMRSPEVFRIPDHQAESWSVRMTPNKFAALQGEKESKRREQHGFFEKWMEWATTK